jgi:phosphoribosylglycinamide formyltransferase-1
VSKKLTLGIHISGRGSNMQALIRACAQPDFPAQVAIVISNVADAPGLKTAADAGIKTCVIPHKDYADKQSFETALDAAHCDAGVDLICNAGFMRIISPYLVQKWQGRMINIHPSLLPAFPGLDTHKRVLDSGALFTGCTVHYMEEGVDTGAIIAQSVVPVLPDDDEQTLSQRVLAAEHILYPHAVRLIAQGKVTYNQGRALNTLCRYREDTLTHPLVTS